MRCRRLSLGWMMILTGCCLAATADKAHAYLDPGTGSYMLQIAIGAALAGAFAIKSYWVKIKGALLRVLGKRRHETEG